MVAFPGTQRHVNVDDVVVAAARAHEPDAARDVRGNDGDVDIARLQQPSQPDLPGTTPRLRDGADGNADAATAPQGLVQAGLHGDGLTGVVEREKRTGVQRKPG